jgi:hypothetical protein
MMGLPMVAVAAPLVTAAGAVWNPHKAAANAAVRTILALIFIFNLFSWRQS